MPLETQQGLEVTQLLQKLNEIKESFEIVESYIKSTNEGEKTVKALDAFMKIKDYILPKQ